MTDRAVALNRDDALDDADRCALRFERGSLFNVELQIAMVRTSRSNRGFDSFWNPSDPPDGLGAGHTAPRCRHVGWRVVAGDDSAAREPASEGDAFFGRPDHHLERMARRLSRAGECLHDTERGEGSEVAVEVAAGD